MKTNISEYFGEQEEIESDSRNRDIRRQSEHRRSNNVKTANKRKKKVDKFSLMCNSFICIRVVKGE